MKKKGKTASEISKIGKKMIFNIDVIPYSQQCIIACNAQMPDILKYMKRMKNLSSGGKETIKQIEDPTKKDYYFEKIKENCGRLFIDLPTGYILIINHSNRDWIDTTCNASHEANHLSQYILRNAGIQLQQETEEAYTYLQAYLLKEILKKIF